MNSILTYFKHPLLKWPLLFGLATGLVCFLYYLLLYALGAPLIRIYNPPFDYGFFVILMVTAVWYYRKYIRGGMLHLWEGLTICYLVNSFGALVVGWLVYLFVTLFDPHMFTQYIHDLQTLQINGKTEFIKQFGQAAFNEQITKTKQMQPSILIADQFQKKTLLAVLPVLVIALIFRKQDYNVLR